MVKLIVEDGVLVVVEMMYDEAKAACGGELSAFIASDMTSRIVMIVLDILGCFCGGMYVVRMLEI